MPKFVGLLDGMNRGGRWALPALVGGLAVTLGITVGWH